MLQLSHAVSGFVGAAAMAGVLLLSGATGKPVSIDTIDTQRVNIREPDGTLRMVLSGAATEPGIIVGGREQPHPNRRSAGILFYNDEGTENGGLIFDGRRARDGVPHSSGSLTFDRYRQDQAVQLEASEDGRDRHAGLVVNDHPEAPLDFAAIERARGLAPAAQAAALRSANAVTIRRAFVGRGADGSAEIQLRDASGANRLVMRVAPSGDGTIAFLARDGRVLRTIAP